MADIKITINSKPYTISCDDGQEERVQELANYVQSRLSDIKKMSGATNDSHLLVLTSLIMADELYEFLEGNTASSSSAKPQPQPAKSDEQSSNVVTLTREEEGAIVDILDKMAGRIDGLSQRLQKIA